MLTVDIAHRKRRFCEEWVIDGNGTRAAIAAGYSKHTAHVQASKLLDDPQVSEYIKYLQANQTIASRVTKEYVLESIVQVLERAKGKIEVEELEENDGEVTVRMQEFKPDHKNALKAAELLGKHLAMFTDVSEQKLTFTQMPDVKVGVGSGNEEQKALTFEVGSEPNGFPNQ